MAQTKAKRQCAVEGCTHALVALGLCHLHWQRQHDGRPIGTTEQDKYYGLHPRARFIKWVEIDENGCWLWTKGKTQAGYGVFRVEGRTVSAHRWAYEEFMGDAIPAGMNLDHLCDTKHCVNPLHLEPVTHGENIRRSWERRKSTSVAAEVDR